MASPFILLIDDHAVFRAGMALLLRSAMSGATVHEAPSLVAALNRDKERPDVVVLDILLQGLNGIEGISLLRRRWPGTPVVLLSSETAPDIARTGLARGATAFVSKEESAETVLAVIRQALAPSTPATIHALPPALPETRLTPRQCEVLDLLCRGLPNKAIGRKLGLAENTVRWHVQAVLEALQVDNRSEAAFAARRMGLIR